MDFREAYRAERTLAALTAFRKLLASYKDEKSLTVRYRADEGKIKALLEYIGKTAAVGHSFSVVVDPGDSEYERKFGFDGDGAFRIIDVSEPKGKDE